MSDRVEKLTPLFDQDDHLFNRALVGGIPDLGVE
jgi:hypothetical protein